MDSVNPLPTTATAVSAKFQDGSIDPHEVLPAFVRRCLHIGAEHDWLLQRCKEGIEELWCDGDPHMACVRFARGYFDAILVSVMPGSEELEEWLMSLAVLLDENGVISVIVPDTISRKAVISQLAAIQKSTGLTVYGDNPATRALRLVFASYNPVRHARRIAASGRPDISVQILARIPQDLIVNEELMAAIAAEKQQYYLAWQKHCDGDPPHSWFSKSQREFAQATAIDPGLYLPYQTQADYWRYMGDDQMAAVIRRNFQQSQMPEMTCRTLKTAAPSSSRRIDAERVEISRSLPDPRILILGHSASDYGMDTLYDGLCRVIGNRNVVEYPSKPTLHGKHFDAAQNYPCTFSHAAGPSGMRDILARLAADGFDIILYADVVEMKRSEEVRLLLKASANLPLVVYDSWDDCYTPMGAILDYIDRDRVDLVFKREMLDCIDYGGNTLPLPFSYPASMLKDIPAYPERPFDFFWAGKRAFGLRPIILQQVEKKMDRKFDQAFEQAAYMDRLRYSRVGLALWGYGFDTVRYWEIPAHGGLLLAQRPPIRIPQNFVDGQTAVFFDDLQELEEKLTHYLDHPEAAEAIAAAGHQHWKTHHTTEARAEQLLRQIEQRCGW